VGKFPKPLLEGKGKVAWNFKIRKPEMHSARRSEGNLEIGNYSLSFGVHEISSMSLVVWLGQSREFFMLKSLIPPKVGSTTAFLEFFFADGH
jgi:hypothetical protein